MAQAELTMSPAQMASPLDAAFRRSHPLDVFDAVVPTLRAVGRTMDAATAAWMGCLHAEGDMEVPMSLRAAWLRGVDRSPAEAARRVEKHGIRSVRPSGTMLIFLPAPARPLRA